MQITEYKYIYKNITNRNKSNQTKASSNLIWNKT